MTIWMRTLWTARAFNGIGQAAGQQICLPTVFRVMRSTTSFSARNLTALCAPNQVFTLFFHFVSPVSHCSVDAVRRPSRFDHETNQARSTRLQRKTIDVIRSEMANLRAKFPTAPVCVCAYCVWCEHLCFRSRNLRTSRLLVVFGCTICTFWPRCWQPHSNRM